MTEQLVGAANQLAQRIVIVGERALCELEASDRTSKEWQSWHLGRAP
jgi:hypothetical protein